MLDNLINGTRRNHALEHATVSIMLNRHSPIGRLVGRAVPDGFFIYGNIPTDVIEQSAHEGLQRLQRGESNLAITPLCGTNIALAAILSGTLSMLSMGAKRRLERLPNVFTAAMLGIIAAQPLGRLVQERLTTRSDLAAT
ncbi:MAG: DUF6391 domain-containing protein, partial [Dehalococcoidia bacterium]